MIRGAPAGLVVLVVADDAAFRIAVGNLLGGVGLATRGAASGEKALIAVEERRPDLVVLDTQLPEMSGYELCHELRERFGEGLGLVFTSATRTESGDRVAGLLLGADDYIVRPFAPDEFVARIRRLVMRSTPDVAAPIAGRLTVREREVLSLLVAGESQAEIALALSISPRTVAKHVEHLVAKLGARNRAHAVALAVRDHLIDDLVVA